MYESLRIIDKLKPKYVLWENVKNVISKKHKHNFDNYIRELSKIGYNSYFEILNAKECGIPQNRERVFTISIRKDIDKGNFTFPAPKPLKLRLKDMLESDVEEKYYLSDEKINNIANWKAYQKPFEKVQGKNSIVPTLTARGAGEEHSGMITYSEILEDTTNLQEQCLKIKNAINQGYQDPKCIQSGNLNHTSYEINYKVYSPLTGLYEDKVKELHCVVASSDVVSKNPSDSKYGSNNVETITNEATGLRIRKLTPKECWRLMGFNDDDFIKARARLNDKMYEGKDKSQSQLYKQAGNSIVVNVLEEIFKILFEERLKAFN